MALPLLYCCFNRHLDDDEDNGGDIDGVLDVQPESSSADAAAEVWW